MPLAPSLTYRFIETDTDGALRGNIHDSKCRQRNSHAAIYLVLARRLSQDINFVARRYRWSDYGGRWSYGWLRLEDSNKTLSLIHI